MELALDAVTSGYGGIPIVREVSLEVGTGEIVAIVGRNGVGKTTLIETIAGLLPVMEGGIEFRGRDVTRADARDRARLGVEPLREAVAVHQVVREHLDGDRTPQDLVYRLEHRRHPASADDGADRVVSDPTQAGQLRHAIQE